MTWKSFLVAAGVALLVTPSSGLADDAARLKSKSTGDERMVVTDGVHASIAASSRDSGRTRGDRRSPRHSPRHGRTRVYRSGPRVQIGVGYGSPYWRGWYGAYGPWGPSAYWWDSTYYYGAWDGPRVYPRAGERYGALDLDVSPERAEVWVDGQRIGVADEFDGFPSYLWLESGTYDVAFYLPGHKTLARQYTIYGGLVIDVEDRLEKGEAVHPTELAATTHVNRDERLRRDRERRERADVDRQRAPSALPASPAALDARGEPGTLSLRVEPADASVYLDGRLLGAAGDLARLRAGLIVDPGPHTLEVVRPGYESARQEFEVDAGEELQLEVDLAEAAVAVN